MDDPSAVRGLLAALTRSGTAIGDLSGPAGEELLPLVYGELRRIAGSAMARERAGHTLQPTALVHEAWLRIAGDAESKKDRGHFLAAAAVAMRRILVERARARQGPQRGGDRARVPLGGVDAIAAEPDALDMLALDQALDGLEARAPRQARVVHLRYFAGLSVDETAAALGVSPATAKADWSYAKAWLHRELERGDPA